MSKFWSDFKAFAMRGNVIDMAVGIIIGAAFGKIVSSLVDDILMPLIGALLQGVDFTQLACTIGDAKVSYGVFIQNTVDFLIIALCVFLMIKAISKFSKKKEEETAAPSTEEKLLTEIRDLLKNK